MLGGQSAVCFQDFKTPINENNFSLEQDLLLSKFQLLIPAIELFKRKGKEGVF